MGKQLEQISPELWKFIEEQKVFFVGTAMSTGKINVSPKGMDSFRIINSNRVIWLNLTGSGNETAAHLVQNNRITIMFCAFEGKPLILRLYGKTEVYHRTDAQWNEYIALFPEYVGARQIIDVEVQLVQTSCGFGVPLMDFKASRDELTIWGEKKGANGISDYWREKNQISIDGYPTGIPK